MSITQNKLVPFFVAGLFFAGAFGMAQSPGMFTLTGSLTTPRQYHTATLLTNGRVLLTGGFAILTGWPVWASAELYDPSTGSFSSTGDMAASRFDHTATLLPDGKVLIAGGSSIVNGISALASAELYDPSTGRFTATGSMTTGRVRHTATLLNNGEVLVTGGWDPRSDGLCCTLYSAELYDPSTGTFTATHDMPLAMQAHTATLLSSGKVLLEGGYSENNLVHPELYDPASGTFSLIGSEAYPGLFATSSSLLTNGNVLVTLDDECDPDDKADLYDPPAGTFTATGNMTKARMYSTATLLPDGKVLIAGGDFPGLNSAGSAELYDPSTGTFSTTGNMLTQSREGHTSTLLPDGTVLLSGGWDCCGYSLNTAEIYRPAVLAESPVLYSLSGGTQGAILHAATQQLVSPNNPAVAGEAVEIYGAGLIDGSAIPPQVAIGGKMAAVLYFGNAPGFPGLNQINVVVPSGVAPGPAVSVRLNYLARPSNEVTTAVQ
jgi:hypothetical protein